MCLERATGSVCLEGVRSTKELTEVSLGSGASLIFLANSSSTSCPGRRKLGGSESKAGISTRELTYFILLAWLKYFLKLVRQVRTRRGRGNMRKDDMRRGRHGEERKEDMEKKGMREGIKKL